VKRKNDEERSGKRKNERSGKRKDERSVERRKDQKKKRAGFRGRLGMKVRQQETNSHEFTSTKQ